MEKAVCEGGNLRGEAKVERMGVAGCAGMSAVQVFVSVRARANARAHTHMNAGCDTHTRTRAHANAIRMPRSSIPVDESMHVCTHVCMHFCIHVPARLHICACMPAYMCTRAYSGACMRARTKHAFKHMVAQRRHFAIPLMLNAMV